jgi:predicted transposase YbfD/YdcC
MNYRKLWEKHYGTIPKDDKGRSYEIHHIDGNRKNNSLSNLRCISIEEHYSIHKEQQDEIACHAIRLRMKIESLKGWHHTEEMKLEFSRTRKGKKHSIETREKMKKSKLGHKHSSTTVKKLSEKKKKPILHIESGVVFDSSKAAAAAIGVTGGTIVNKIKEGLFKVITQEEYSKLQKNKMLPLLYKKQKGGDTQKKKLEHVKTGVIYNSLAEAAKHFNIAPSNIHSYIKRGVFKYSV